MRSPWISESLGNLVEVLDSQRIPVNSDDRYLRSGCVPYYGANGIQGFIDKAIFNEPLILLAEDGGNFDDFATRPIAYRIDGPSWVNNHAHVIRARPGIHQQYIFWSLVHKNIRRFIAGGTRSKLTQGELKVIEIRRPPYDEQRGIAEVLDTLDETIRTTEHLIAKLQQSKQGLLHDLLTRGIDDNGELRDPERHPEQFKDSILGRLPVGWQVRPVGEAVSSLIDYRGRTPKKIGMNWGGGEIPALSAKNVRMGSIDLSLETYYGSDALYEKWMTNGACKQGDVLVTMEAPLGNIAQIPDERRYILSQRVVLFRFDENLAMNDYMAILMRSEPFQTTLVKHSTGTTATGIQRTKFVKIPIPIPTLAEQERICSSVVAAERRLTTEQNTLEKFYKLKHGLMDDLLTGRVRVPLDTGPTA